MKKILLLSILVFMFCGRVFAGTVTFDQLSPSGDLTAAKYNADLNRIFIEFNTNTQSSNIANDTVAEVDMADDSNPRIRTYEGAACEKVYSGLLPATTSGTLAGSVPSGTAYPLGYRVVKSSNTAKTWTATKWTFVDIDINGDFTYSEVTIGGSTPAVATNSIRLARVSADGTQVVDVQDLRTTNCATGPFSAIADASQQSSLDDLFKNGQPVRRFSLGGRTPNGWAQGAYVSWDTHTTFKVTAGSLYINGKYRSVSQDITVAVTNDDPTAGTSGLDAGSVTGGPVRYCVYGVADQDSTKSFSVTYSLSCASPAGVTNYRYIGAINIDVTNLFTSRDVITAHAISERELLAGWITFTGSSTITVRDAFNVSGISDNGTGDYTVTWDKNMYNNNYPVFGVLKRDSSNTEVGVMAIRSIATNPSADAVRVITMDSTFSAADMEQVHVLAAGDTRA